MIERKLGAGRQTPDYNCISGETPGYAPTRVLDMSARVRSTDIYKELRAICAHVVVAFFRMNAARTVPWHLAFICGIC